MASTYNIEGLELKGITNLNRDELGRGALIWTSLRGQVLPNNMCR